MNNLDILVALSLASRIHGDNKAIKDTARRLIPKVPRASRHLLKMVIRSNNARMMVKLTLDKVAEAL